MTHIGCMTWLLLFAALTILGTTNAIRRHHSIFLGFATGVLVWLALLGAYLSAMSIVDWRTRKTRKPDLIGVPWWFVPAIWITFVLASAGGVLLVRRLFDV